jgi:hypothetical protein
MNRKAIRDFSSQRTRIKTANYRRNLSNRIAKAVEEVEFRVL